MLYNALPEEDCYFTLNEKKICVIQKEYRMADPCGKPKKQHWDISIIDSSAINNTGRSIPYDDLPLNSAIEFGMNESNS